MTEQENIIRMSQLIYRIWKKPYNSSLRLTQLILNVFKSNDFNEAYNCTDEELEKRLREMYGDKLDKT